MDIHKTWIAGQMLARVKAGNATEVQRKAFPKVLVHTVQRHLKEQGLVCHIQRSKPFLSVANEEKQCLWALQHSGWTVKDWKQVIFSDESKYMLFKLDGCQYYETWTGSR